MNSPLDEERAAQCLIINLGLILHPLQNIKQKDYLDFKEGLSIIHSGLHLTPEALAKFKAIKERMNSFRSS